MPNFGRLKLLLTLHLVAGVLAIGSVTNALASDDYIMFPSKLFDQTDYQIIISGTLTGTDSYQDLSPYFKNNTYGISCTKDRRECLISYVRQIGPNQIGRLDPYSIPISKWNADVVVAADPASDFACYRTTITITRKTETVLWVEEPINSSDPHCRNADGKVKIYTIEDSLGSKSMRTNNGHNH